VVTRVIGALPKKNKRETVRNGCPQRDQHL
jgi:hypothetical protein